MGLFFNPRSGFLPPVSNGLLTAFFRARFRLLATPSHSGQNMPYMTRMVADGGHLFDDRRNAVARPDVRGMTSSNRPFEQDLLDFFFLACGELSFLARMAFGA